MRKIILISLFIAISTQFAAAGSDPIGYWSFDENSGTLAGDSAGGNDGSISGAIWQLGVKNSCLDFDGQEDYVEIGHNPAFNFSEAFTLSCWARSESMPTESWGMTICNYNENGQGNYSGYILGRLKDSNIDNWIFYVTVGEESVSFILSDSTPSSDWQHLAATRDETGKIVMYINGIAQQQTSTAAGNITNIGSLHFGNFSAGDAYYFDGQIDEIAIYNKALTAGEIQQLYNQTIGKMVGLEIAGPTEVFNNTSVQYNATALYENGHTGDVTSIASWSLEPTDHASISSEGLLTTNHVDEPQIITISCQYVVNGNVFDANQTLLVHNEPFGQVANWKFDEDSGDIASDSAGSNNGTVYGPNWVDGLAGNALQFDGVDDYVGIPTSDIFDFETGDFSISMWFKTSGPINTFGEQYLIDFRQNDNDPHIEIYTTVENPFGLLGTHLLSPDFRIPYNLKTVHDDKWHHVAVTLNNGVAHGYKLYLDGENVGQITASATLKDWDTIKIGGDNVHGAEFFNGLIDDVCIFDRALTGEEIAHLYAKNCGELLGLEIVGADDVFNGFSTNYKAMAIYEAGRRDVTSLATWSVEPNDYATISSGGLLKTQESDQISDIVINCRYTENEVMVETNKQVLIRNQLIGLVCHWALDEGSGSNASDSVSNINGIIHGAKWVQSDTGTALEFDGVDDYIWLSNIAINTTEFTISAWANHFGSGGGQNKQNPIFCQRDDTENNDCSTIGLFTDIGNNINYASSQVRSSSGSLKQLYAAKKDDNQWHHYAMTVDDDYIRFYINGKLINSSITDQAGNYVTSIDYVDIGRSVYAGTARGFFNGLIDDVSIYETALTEEEVGWLYSINLPQKPFNPAPADKSMRVQLNSPVSWFAGADAADVKGYDVYFGTDFNDVNDANISSNNYMGRQSLTTYDPNGSGDMETETTYYWRIDQVSDGNNILKGNVWNFTTTNGLPFVYVNIDGTADFTGIQQAIDYAFDGDIVIVSPGEYFDNIDFLGKKITVTSTDPNDPDIVAGTIINGNSSGSVVTFKSYETSKSIIEGFTITGGSGTADTFYYENPDYFWGGGILCYRSSPTIRCNVITTNHLPTEVNGSYLYGYGGGIACLYSDAIICQNTIQQNDAYDSGGISCRYGNAKICKNIIHNNSAAYRGGGLNVYSSSNNSPLVSNNFIYSNSAGAYGGGIYLYRAGQLINNTIVTNNAGNYGGNIYVYYSNTSLAIYNNIISHAAASGGIYWNGELNSSLIKYNDVFDNTGGDYLNIEDQTGKNDNISENPLFVDAANNNYHLSINSRCISAGDPSYAPQTGETDIDGDPRVWIPRIDIGADEYIGHVKPVADAGPDQHFINIQMVQLDGSGSFFYDANSSSNIFNWLQVSGPSVQLSSQEAQKPSFATTSEGTYQFRLSVQDEVGVGKPDVVTIIVGNNIPVVNAGPNITFKQCPSRIYLDGSSSYDVDCTDTLTYQWIQTSGPEVTLSDPHNPQPYFEATSKTTYTFQLVVSDGYSNSAPASVNAKYVELTSSYSEFNAAFSTSDYFHYPDISGNKVVYGVGSGSDFTWTTRAKNLTTGGVTKFTATGTDVQPKADGNYVVWFGVGSKTIWDHEPSNSSVLIGNLNDTTSKF